MINKLINIFRIFAGWITKHEIWILVFASPFMLFPIGILPFIAMGLILLTWICRLLSYGRLSYTTGVDLPILIILCMALIGYVISVDQALSETRLWSLILGIVLFYGITNAVKLDKGVEAVAFFISLLTIAIAGIGLVGTDWQQTRLIDIPWLYNKLPSLIRNLPGSGVPRGSDLINPRLVGNTLGMLVPVLIALLFFSRNKNIRIISLISIIFGFGTLLLSQALAGLAGVLVAFLFLIIWRKRIFILAIPFGLSIGLISLLLIDPYRIVRYLLSIDNPIGIAVAIRLDIWSRAFSMIKDMPFTGIGLNTFHIIQSDFYTGYIIGPEPHAHNLYIQTALDLGLPGLLVLLWLIAGWIFVVWRKYQANNNREIRVLLLGLIAGVFAYLAHGFIDALMLGSKPGVVFWILIGLGAVPITSVDSKKQKAIGDQSQPIKQLPLFIILTGILVIYILIKPASIYMNIGAIQAHKSLEQVYSSLELNSASMEKAKGFLNNVVSLDAGYLNAYELLGRIYAWRDEPSRALDAFAHRVALDGKDPFLRYYPSEGWFDWINDKEINENQNWNELIQVYTQWMSRYPNRAETYSEISIVWQCYLADLGKASGVLKSGIDRQAQPSELLSYHQNLLSQGNDSICFK